MVVRMNYEFTMPYQSDRDRNFACRIVAVRVLKGKRKATSITPPLISYAHKFTAHLNTYHVCVYGDNMIPTIRTEWKEKNRRHSKRWLNITNMVRTEQRRHQRENTKTQLRASKNCIKWTSCRQKNTSWTYQQYSPSNTLHRNNMKIVDLWISFLNIRREWNWTNCHCTSM